MICRVDGTDYSGRIVTVEESVAPHVLARAVRRGEAVTDGTTVAVRACQPHPVHERVGCLDAGMGLRVRTALAEAARARGLSTALDEQIRATRERLADLTVEGADATDERRAVAAASAETEQLRETVDRLQGELTARRETDTDASATADEFRDAARRLSEAETSTVEARQDLARCRRDARAARDRLERRLALEDDLANLRRRARTRLVERTRDAYARAVEAVPGRPDTVADPFDVDPLTARLAVARVAAFDAPVVLACDRFTDAGAASAWLGAPVIACGGR